MYIYFFSFVQPYSGTDRSSNTLIHSPQRCPVRLSDPTSSVLESKRRNPESKLAQVAKPSEFTHSGQLIAAGHRKVAVIITHNLKCNFHYS